MISGLEWLSFIIGVLLGFLIKIRFSIENEIAIYKVRMERLKVEKYALLEEVTIYKRQCIELLNKNIPEDLQ